MIVKKRQSRHASYESLTERKKMNIIYNCFICNKKVQFENSDDTYEEYEVDEEGNKYCSFCYGEENNEYNI